MTVAKFLVPALATLLAAMPATAQTVGNAAVAASETDGCGQCTFVINQAFSAGRSIGTYNFYANSTSAITPLLLTRTDVGNAATFTVVGVGTTRTAAFGVNTFDFGLTQGVNTTTASSYFGFAYTNGGVVAFYYPNTTTPGTFVGPSGDTGGLGTSFTDDSSTQIQNSYSALNARVYSINATAVPEPATWAMMLVGFGMVGFGLRSRRQQQVRVTFG